MNSQTNYDDLRKELEDAETVRQNLELEISVCHKPNADQLRDLSNVELTIASAKRRMSEIEANDYLSQKEKFHALDYCANMYASYSGRNKERSASEFKRKYSQLFESLWNEGITDPRSLWPLMLKELK